MRGDISPLRYSLSIFAYITPSGKLCMPRFAYHPRSATVSGVLRGNSFPYALKSTARLKPSARQPYPSSASFVVVFSFGCGTVKEPPCDKLHFSFLLFSFARGSHTVHEVRSTYASKCLRGGAFSPISQTQIFMMTLNKRLMSQCVTIKRWLPQSVVDRGSHLH